MSSRGEVLSWSNLLRTRERDGTTAVFHELHPDPVYMPTVTWDDVQGDIDSLSAPLSMALRDRGLLVFGNEDDRDLARARQELLARLDRASILYLVLVQGCNFSCAYCPIPELARVKGYAEMSSDTARASIDLWTRHVAEDSDPDAEYALILYGGEPLLNEPAIHAALEHIQRRQADGALPSERLSIMLSTNGVLIDTRLARMLRDCGVAVAVGCDGPERYHDAIRRDSDGRATYHAVTAAIRTLVEEGVTTYASVSITPYNLDAISRYSEFFQGLGIARFGFNFLRGKLLFRLVPPEQLTEYYERATDGVLANYDNFGRHLEYQLERKHQALLERRFFPVDCNGYGNQLVIEPDGSIGNCPFIAGDMGSVAAVPSTFRIRDVPAVRAWRGRLPLFAEHCQPCDAKSICGGGCAWNAQELKGDPLALDDAMCLLTRKVFDRLIWPARLTPPASS